MLTEGRDFTEPLVIGSVKTNIGHLESAAGVAGFIKVVLALQHQVIPRHLNFTVPNPHIDWGLPVTVANEQRPWPRAQRPSIAGVSSFGFSGTNAHAILEAAPTIPMSTEANDRPLHCLVVSAKSDAALRRLSRLYANVLGKGELLSDVAHTAAIGRSHLKERLAIVTADAEEARSALLAASVGRPYQNMHRGTVASGSTTDVVFLCTGAGAQYPGMGQALYNASPVFRDVIDRCDDLLGADAEGRSLKTILTEPGDDAAIHGIAWTEPAMFALECGLIALWRSWGVTPAAVIGHSVGEYVAAYAAGVFSLEDGIMLIAKRGRLLANLPPGGQMAAVFAGESEVTAAIAPFADRVAIAAVNGPANIVISGEDSAVGEVLAGFANRGIMGQRLFVSLTAHSLLVAPARTRWKPCAQHPDVAADNSDRMEFNGPTAPNRERLLMLFTGVGTCVSRTFRGWS